MDSSIEKNWRKLDWKIELHVLLKSLDPNLLYY